MQRTGAANAAFAALVFLLASHACIALGYRPAVSDTSLYSLYAFVTSNASRAGLSPYDYFERMKRQSAMQQGMPVPSSDQMTIEYPPLALALLQVALPFVAKDGAGLRGAGRQDSADWARGFRLLYFLAHAAVMAGAFGWLHRRGFSCSSGLLVGALAGVVLAYVLYDRLDLWLGLALTAALGALVTGRRYLAMLLFAVAVNLKLVPILLAPLFVLGTLPTSAMRDGLLRRRTAARIALGAAGLVGACLAVFLPFRLMWGPRVWDFLGYHGQRGLQVESTWSSFLLVAAELGYPARLVHEFGADEVVGPGTAFLSKASSWVTLTLVALAYGLFWRALRRRPAEGSGDPAPTATLAEQHCQLFVWGSFAVLAFAMATAKVFSPQYLCWFLPALVLAQGPKNARGAAPFLVFLLACGLTAMVFPNLWPEVIRPVMLDGKLTLQLPTTRAVLAILTRNLVWMGFCVLAIVQLYAPASMQTVGILRPKSEHNHRRGRQGRKRSYRS